MSNTKWTPEPVDWTLEHYAFPQCGIHRFGIGFGDGRVLFNGLTAMTEADGKRVVECLRACDGIANPAEAIKAAREALDGLIFAAEVVDGQESPADADDVARLHKSIADARRALALLGKGASHA